jgi:hypothetical protein
MMTTEEWRALCPKSKEQEAVRKSCLAAGLPNLGWLNGAPQFPEGFDPDWDAVEAIARRAIESLSSPPPEIKQTQPHKANRKKVR